MGYQEGFRKGWVAILMTILTGIGPAWTALYADDIGRSSNSGLLSDGTGADRPSAILADFQVNENEGYCDKWQPAVATDRNGNSVMVWLDLREGFPCIYGQRFENTGSARGPNFRVSGGPDLVMQEMPRIAMSAKGNFIIAWQDSRNGYYDIYARRFSLSGAPLGDDFRVNTDPPGASIHQLPAVAADTTGNFIIAWQDHRNMNSVIYAQRFDASGVARGFNFVACGDAQNFIQTNPGVSVDGAGNFAVVWTDERNGNRDIYIQVYNPSGTRTGNNVRVNDDAGNAAQANPSMSVDADGNGMVVWEDGRNTNKDIYAQRFKLPGTAQEKNFRINDDTGTADQAAPSVTVDGFGNFTVTWEDDRNGNRDIYCHRFLDPWVMPKPNFRVNDDSGTKAQKTPGIAAARLGGFTVVWMDGRNDIHEIYAQRYDASGAGLKTNFWVTNDAGSSHQTEPDIAVNPAGNFMVAWQDRRNGTDDLYAQCYDPSGAAQGGNFRVDSGTGGSPFSPPAVAADGNGNFIVTWKSKENGFYAVYARRYGANGAALAAPFMVSIPLMMPGSSRPSAAATADGRFVIAWDDTRNGNSDVYARLYDGSGQALGADFRVNDNAGDSSQDSPSAAMDHDGNILIVWSDDRNGNFDIYAQRISASGIAQKSNFWINDDPGVAWQTMPSATVDGNGNFTVAWIDERSPAPGIYAQRLSGAGIVMGKNFKVTDEAAYEMADIFVSIAADEAGRLVTAWTRLSADDMGILEKRLTSQGKPEGVDFCPVRNTRSVQIHPSVQLHDKKIYTAWQTSHAGGTGFDVWANVLDWDMPISPVQDSGGAVPASFSLSQNFPNPANPGTVIPYSIRKTGPVHLVVCDIRGRLVRVLADGIRESGTHSAFWAGDDGNGASVPSGIYLCHLEAGGRRSVIRMVLVR